METSVRRCDGTFVVPIRLILEVVTDKLVSMSGNCTVGLSDERQAILIHDAQ